MEGDEDCPKYVSGLGSVFAPPILKKTNSLLKICFIDRPLVQSVCVSACMHVSAFVCKVCSCLGFYVVGRNVGKWARKIHFPSF